MKFIYGNGRVSLWFVDVDAEWVTDGERYFCQFCGKDLSNNSRLRRFCSTKCESSWYREVKIGDSWEMFRYRVFERDNNRCKICGKERGQRSDFICDHIIPLFKGGKDWWEDWQMINFQTLCPECNKVKTANDLRNPPNYVSLAEVFFFNTQYGALEKFL